MFPWWNQKKYITTQKMRAVSLEMLVGVCKNLKKVLAGTGLMSHWNSLLALSLLLSTFARSASNTFSSSPFSWGFTCKLIIHEPQPNKWEPVTSKTCTHCSCSIHVHIVLSSVACLLWPFFLFRFYLRLKCGDLFGTILLFPFLLFLGHLQHDTTQNSIKHSRG